MWLVPKAVMASVLTGTLCTSFLESLTRDGSTLCVMVGDDPSITPHSYRYVKLNNNINRN